MGKSLPVIMPRIEGQRFACASCTRCCRDLVVHLFAIDVKHIQEQGWSTVLDRAPYVKLGHGLVLNKRPDGACVFLEDDGKCAIHRKFGFEAKPLACRLYPFTLRRHETRWQAGLRFDCPSVVGSHGAPLGSHHGEIGRLARLLADAVPRRSDRVRLQAGVAATPEEYRCVMDAFDEWMRAGQGAAGELEHRLRCAAFVTDMLCRAKLAKVRGPRFQELVTLLFSGAGDEIEAMSPDVPPLRARRLLRQLAYVYGEAATLAEMRSGPLAKARLVWRHLRQSRHYRRGRGPIQNRDGSAGEVTFEQVDVVQPVMGDDVEGTADLITRYTRQRLQSESVAGAGYYDWPLFDGLAAMWLSVVVIAWHARRAAALNGRDRLTLDDIGEATRLVDRAAGRVPALGTASERLRTRYLTQDGGLQHLLTAYPLVAVGAEVPASA